MTSNRIFHIQNLTLKNIKELSNLESIVIGSTFCRLCRIDNNYTELSNILGKIKTSFPVLKIYLQQPYYLIGDEEYKFVDIIKKAFSNNLIDGVLINNIGMAKLLSDISGLCMIFSRFGIGKRKRTNKHLIQLLEKYGVFTYECFENDSNLLNDLNEHNIDIWIRRTKKPIHSFSRNCFVEFYEGECCHNPDVCQLAEAVISYKDNIKLNVAGHLLYYENYIDRKQYQGKCKTEVINLSDFEM